jgi:hypothetical protein
MKFLLWTKTLGVKVDGSTEEKECSRLADLLGDDEKLAAIFDAATKRIKELVPNSIIEEDA